MTAESRLLLILARLVVLVLGIALTTISFRAYQREGTRYLRDSTIGFAIITIGVLIEGILFEIFSVGLESVHIIESLAIGLGFAVLLSSFLR